MMKLHMSIHHDIVSVTSVLFAGQDLSLTYLTGFVKHSQICVRPLCFTPFLKRLNNFFGKKLDTNLPHNIITAVSLSFSDPDLVFTLGNIARFMSAHFV